MKRLAEREGLEPPVWKALKTNSFSPSMRFFCITYLVHRSRPAGRQCNPEDLRIVAALWTEGHFLPPDCGGTPL